MSIPLYQQRVLDEAKELQTKIVALQNFRFTETFEVLEQIDKDHLEAQEAFMIGYLTILGQRISRFAVDTET